MSQNFKNNFEGCATIIILFLMLLFSSAFMYFTIYNYVALPTLGLCDVVIPKIGYFYFMPIGLSLGSMRRKVEVKYKDDTEACKKVIQRVWDMVLTSIVLLIMYFILY